MLCMHMYVRAYTHTHTHEREKERESIHSIRLFQGHMDSNQTLSYHVTTDFCILLSFLTLAAQGSPKEGRCPWPAGPAHAGIICHSLQPNVPETRHLSSPVHQEIIHLVTSLWFSPAVKKRGQCLCFPNPQHRFKETVPPRALKLRSVLITF